MPGDDKYLEAIISADRMSVAFYRDPAVDQRQRLAERNVLDQIDDVVARARRAGADRLIRIGSEDRINKSAELWFWRGFRRACSGRLKGADIAAAAQRARFAPLIGFEAECAVGGIHRRAAIQQRKIAGRGRSTRRARDPHPDAANNSRPD